MKIVFFLVVVFFSNILLSAPDTSTASPCEADLIKLCEQKKQIINIATLACLNKNMDKLSSECKKQFPVLAKQVGPCFLDTLTRCTNGAIPTSQIQDLPCLQKNRELISPECRKLVEQNELNSKKKTETLLSSFEKACESEYKSCGGSITVAQRNCLANMYKQNKVSSACKQGIDAFKKKSKAK